MFISFFRTSHLVNLLVLPLVLLVMWVFILPKPQIVNTENAFPLFLSLLSFTISSRELMILLSLLLVVLQAFFLTTVINTHSVLKENSHLPALMYVVLMSCFPEQLSFNPLLFTNFFIILFFNALFHFYRAESAVFHVFDAGLFVGVAALFYWPSMFLFPLIWAALVLLRPFAWREWLASLLGLLLPFVYFLGTLYWFDMMSISSIRAILQPFYNVEFSTVYNNTYILLFAILSLILLASIWSFSRELGTFAKLRTRKYLILMVWFFLFAALSYLVSVKRSMVSLSFLAIPFSVIISNYFLSLRNRILAETIFLLLLVAVIYNQVLYFLTFYPV
ncbi:MAG: hypothetical protein IT240_04110 [Bacteroidia bacterium]|nr:hypothetical protein [Bacteroidia bacterium]MCC6768205.1 hypothetical protein [Bacteroidia bacterium]